MGHRPDSLPNFPITPDVKEVGTGQIGLVAGSTGDRTRALITTEAAGPQNIAVALFNTRAHIAGLIVVQNDTGITSALAEMGPVINSLGVDKLWVTITDPDRPQLTSAVRERRAQLPQKIRSLLKDNGVSVVGRIQVVEANPILYVHRTEGVKEFPIAGNVSNRGREALLLRGEMEHLIGRKVATPRQTWAHKPPAPQVA